MAAEMDDLEPRRSKALPVAVAGGIAVAVFGILFAIKHGAKTSGSGKEDPTPKPVIGEKIEKNDKGDAKDPPVVDAKPDAAAVASPPDAAPVAAATPDAARAAPVVPDAAPKAGKPDSGSHAVTADAGSHAVTPDKPKEPDKPKVMTLAFNVKPVDAKITVDGKPVSGGKIQLPIGEKIAKVVISAPGYAAFEKDVTPTKDESITIELRKLAVDKPPDTPPKPRDPQPHKPKKPKVEL